MKISFRTYYFFLILFLFPTYLHSQHFSDIEQKMELLPEDTAKVNQLLRLGKHYCSINNQKALYYLQESLFLSNKLNYKKGTAYSYLWLGRVYYYKDEYDLAKMNLNKSMGFFEELNDMDGLAFNYFAMGSISDLMGDYINALKEYQGAVKYSILAKNEQFRSMGLYCIGAVHIDRNETDEGLEYINESLAIRLSLNDSAGIANIYNFMAKAFEQKMMNDSALQYYKKGLNLRKKIGDIRAIANSEYALGIFLIKIEEYSHAINYLENARNHYVELKEQTGLCIANTYLALALNYTGKMVEAERLISSALTDAQRFENPVLIGNCYKVMAQMAANNSNFQRAYQLALQLKTLDDSMAIVNKEEIIQDLEARYKLESKNNQIELLKSQAIVQNKNIIILSISMGALFLILMLIAVLFRLKAIDNRRQKKIIDQNKIIRQQEEKIKEKELQLLQESVELKNRELAAKAIEMLRINETIGEIISRLESLKNIHSDNSKINTHIREIVRELENQTNTNTWKEFNKIFKNIHTGFYNNLLEKCPSLTASEIKIAALLKLNLSTKEIAAISYKTEEGIKSTRYRLRKKLDLSGEDNLIPFLMKL